MRGVAFAAAAALMVCALAAAGAAAPSSGAMWVPGKHYQVLATPQSTIVAPGKIEVIEFFSYGCPNCYAFEPALEQWEQQKAPDVELVRVPIAWDSERLQLARLYHTLVVLKRTDLHRKVFDHIHGLQKSLTASDAAEAYQLQLAFARTHGVKQAAFQRAYESAAVNELNERARKLMYAYKVSSLPSVFVNGRYLTDAAMTRNARTLVALLNDLTAMETQRVAAEAAPKPAAKPDAPSANNAGRDRN